MIVDTKSRISARGRLLALACGSGLLALTPFGAAADPEEGQVRQGDRATVEQFGRALGTNIDRSVRRKMQRDRRARADAGEGTEQQVAAGTDGGQSFQGPFSFYVNGAYSDHEVRLRDLRSDQELYTGLIGLDAFVHDKLLLGLSVGNSDLKDIAISNFGALFRTRTSSQTLTIALYGAYIFTDKTYIDVAGGYHSISRSQQSAAVATGTPVFATSMDDDAYFMSANFNYINDFGPWTVGGLAGFQATRFFESAFTDTIGGATTPATKRLDALITLKAEVGYRFEMVRPYASVALEYAPSERPVTAGAFAASGLQVSDDRGNVRLALGIDVDVGPFTLSAEVQTVQLYERHDEIGGFLNAKFNF